MPRTYLRLLAFAGALAILGGACSSRGDSASTTISGVSTTSSTAGEDTAASTTSSTAASGPGIAVDASGAVTLDSDSLAPLFFAFVEGDGTDPFWHIHTEEASGGGFFSLEMYTVFGPMWTGELGTFDIDCSEAGTGICPHFTPPGSDVDAGADFAAMGSVDIVQLDAEGYDVTATVAFTDGTTVGPVQLVG